MTNERAARSAICEAARHLYERDHNAPVDGNISIRLSERYLLCTPSLEHKGRLTPDRVVKVASADGRPVEAKQRASSELRMHVAIYAARPDVHAIVHAHSPSTVGLSVAGVSMADPVVPEAILALGGVPTVPYESPTTPDVAEAVVPYATRGDAFILERHGPVALGQDLDEAMVRLEIIEHTARITVAALAAGGAPPLPQAEADHLRHMAVTAGILRAPAVRALAASTPHVEREIIERIAARVLEELRQR